MITYLGFLVLWIIVGQLVLTYGIPMLKPKWFNDENVRVNKNFFNHLVPSHMLKTQIKIFLKDIGTLVVSLLENCLSVISSLYQVILYTVLWPVVLVTIKLRINRYEKEKIK